MANPYINFVNPFAPTSDGMNNLASPFNGIGGSFGLGGNPTQAGSLIPRGATPEDWKMALGMAKIRDQKMASAMQNQAQPNGQMVGGWYVPPAMTERLNGLAQNYMGGMEIDQRDKQIEAMIASLRKE